MAIAALATLAGMFMILDSRADDQRLVLAGQRTGPLLAGRLTLIALAAAAATGVSLAVTPSAAPMPASHHRTPAGQAPTPRAAPLRSSLKANARHETCSSFSASMKTFRRPGKR